MAVEVVAAVELLAAVVAAEGPHAAVDVHVPLQVVLVVLATEMDAAYGAVNPLGPLGSLSQLVQDRRGVQGASCPNASRSLAHRGHITAAMWCRASPAGGP